MENENTIPKQGRAGYQRRRDERHADPEFQPGCEEEAPKKDLWLQLVEARLTTALTQKQVAKRMAVSQAQVARIEKAGYDAYTLRTLRRYLEALGDEFTLEIAVKRRERLPSPVHHVAA